MHVRFCCHVQWENRDQFCWLWKANLITRCPFKWSFINGLKIQDKPQDSTQPYWAVNTEHQSQPKQNMKCRNAKETFCIPNCLASSTSQLLLNEKLSSVKPTTDKRRALIIANIPSENECRVLSVFLYVLHGYLSSLEMCSSTYQPVIEKDVLTESFTS